MTATTTPWQRLASLVRAWRDRREDGETEVYDLILPLIESGLSTQSMIDDTSDVDGASGLFFELITACVEAEDLANRTGDLRDTMRLHRLVNEMISVRREIMERHPDTTRHPVKTMIVQPEIETTMPENVQWPE